MSPASDLSAIRLPRNYDVELLQRDLQTLQEVRRAPQPGPYHKGEWTGIALYSMGGKQSTFPSAAGTEHYQETEELQSAPYFRQILHELECPKEVVRILFLPPEGHIKDHFDFHTSFQFGLLRLHLPIITHPDVIFIIDGQQVVMNPGELWYGDFSKVHSVKNNSQVVRVHMVIDVQINDFVLNLFPADFIARPEIRLDASRDTVRRQKAIWHNNRCPAWPARRGIPSVQPPHNELKKEQRCFRGLSVVGEVPLNAALLLTAERRVGKNNVDSVAFANVRESKPQSVAWIDVGRIHPV